MRIAYLASVRIPNEKASGLAISKQCEALAQAGHEVTLLYPRRSNHISETLFSYYNIPEVFTARGLWVVTFIEGLGKLGFALTRFSNMCSSALYIWRNRHQLDVLYARDQWLLFIPMSFFRGTVVWEAHTKHDNLVTRLVGRDVDHIIAISIGLQEFYSQYLFREDVMVLPSGVDVQQFENLPSDTEIKTELGIPTDKKIVGYIGKYTTMGETKGVDELIVAFAEIATQQADCYLLIVGLEEKEFQMVSDICERAGLHAHQYGLRTLEQARFARYILACDVLVMNYPNTEHYRLYMSPVKLFAYLVSGKQIVATDLPSITSVATEDRITLAQPGDMTSLVNAVQTALQKPAVSRPASFESEYSWSARAKKIMAAI